MNDIQVKANVEVREVKTFTVEAVEVAIKGTSVICRRVKVVRLKSGHYSFRAIQAAPGTPWLCRAGRDGRFDGSDTVHVTGQTMVTIIVNNNTVVRDYAKNVYDLLASNA